MFIFSTNQTNGSNFCLDNLS